MYYTCLLDRENTYKCSLFFLCKLHKVRNLGLQSNSVFLFSVFSVLEFNIKNVIKKGV